MASRQVLKLCEKIEKDCGVACIPDTFHVERLNQSFYLWNMDIDIDRSTGFSQLAIDNFGLEYPLCASNYYMKDLLKAKKLGKRVLIGDDEVVIYIKE